MTKFILTEGAKVDAFDAESLLAKKPIVPYDALAIGGTIIGAALRTHGGPG